MAIPPTGRQPTTIRAQNILWATRTHEQPELVPGAGPHADIATGWMPEALAEVEDEAADLSNKTLLAMCLGNFTREEWNALPPEARGAWLENATDVQRAVAEYRAYLTEA